MASPQEVKKKLELVLPKEGRQSIVPFIHGAPGIGKSAIVKQIAKERKLQVIDLRLSQHESSDIKGIPLPDPGENISRWLPPEFIPFKTTKRFEGTKGILFLDELNRAAPDVLQTVFQLVLDRKVGNLELLDEWHIVAAGNLGDEDGCDVVELDPALNNRFIHFFMQPDVKSWLKWAEKNNVHLDIINFIKTKPGYLFRKFKTKYDEEFLVTPRSWEAFSNIIKQNEDKKIDQIAAVLGSDIVGPAAIHFLKYLEEKNVIKPSDVINKYKEVLPKLKMLSREQVYALNFEIAKYIGELKRITNTHLTNFYKYINEILEKDIKIALLQQVTKELQKSKDKNKEDFIDKYFAKFEEEAVDVIDTFANKGATDEADKNA